MSRPISIANTQKSEPVASPTESLVKSIGAQQIVDSVCGSSPLKSYGRHISNNVRNELLPNTPEFQFSTYMHQGGKVLGQNTLYMFGTPPSCACAQENIPINNLSLHLNNMSLHLNSMNNNYLNPNWNAPSMFSLTSPLPSHSCTDIPIHQAPTLRVPVQCSSATDIFSPPSRESTSPDDLLSRYRSNPMKGLKLSDIRGQVIKFAKDQVGSRFIQQKLEFCDSKEKDAIFDEVVAHAPELVDDIFGNYVVQKFFEYGEEKHWARLVDAVVDRIPEYAFQMYACRVLQKALEKVSEPLQIKILARVRHVIHRCMKDQNGNHVIQKAIEKVSPPYVQFIVSTLLENPDTIYDMSVDPYGCRVVQRCLEHCIPQQTRPVIERIHERFDDIANNQYGNYVVQHVILHGSDADRMLIVNRVADNLFEFSTHKYSSNVIEKCLERGAIHHKAMLVGAACSQPEGCMPIVVQMMKDQYANYVVQKMFDQVTSDQRRELILTVRSHIPVLRQFPHGKHILAKLDKYFQKQVVMNYGYSDMSGSH
ncbi:CRE-PUF-8 protein [Caenorhabditis remanei]|uniref:CRE-PUF-8 protein n=1 Tax=Caenorhabditis remanei TaxID=31234 RepID=E3LQG2_CAERE|nr:CRE-PUF-8 protein [Caenorhabditis remanei]